MKKFFSAFSKIIYLIIPFIYIPININIYGKCNCCCKNKNNTIENKTNNTFSIIYQQKGKIKLDDDKKKKENEIIEKKRQEQLKKEEEKIRKLEEERKRQKEEAEKIKREEEERKRKEEAEKIKREDEERKRREEEEKKRREEEERKRKEEADKIKREEEERKRKEEEERKRKEEEERKRKEEEERKRKEEEERKRKEEEERKRKEEEERKRKEEADKIKREEEERKRKEEAEKIKREEEERKRKEEEEEKKKKEEENRLKKEEEEKKKKEEEERLKREEEERKRREEEAKKQEEEENIQTYNVFPHNKYEYKEEIGEGGFGKVFKYYDKRNNRDVAIKKITQKNFTDFEFKYLKKLDHENIIKIYDTFKVKNTGKVKDKIKDTFFIVMEKCEKSLTKTLEYNLDINKQAFIFYQLINGLEYLHNKNIIHSDIKTDNILFSKDNILKIADFGLSFYLNDKKDNKIGGTMSFISPELLLISLNGENGHNTFESDIWACGIILYEILTCKRAFQINSGKKLLKELNNIEKYINNLPKDTDKDAKDLIRQILTIDPKERITIDKIKKHPFYLRGYEEYKKIIK